MSITAEQIQSAVSLGIQVHAGQISRTAAVQQLMLVGMGQSSASGYLYVFKKMLDGAPYARTINLSAIRIYLDGIHQEYGSEQTQKAIHSVRAHLRYYSDKTGNGGKSTIDLIEAKQHELGLVEPPTPTKLALLSEAWGEDLSTLTDDDLLARANEKRDGPFKSVMEVTVYQRNPAVREQALRRAKGKCGGCKADAPFKKSSGRAFLEVHHIIPLSENGPDEIENVIALCPNCHRKAHFSADTESFKEALKMSLEV